jgi:hypothetical protein
MNWWFVVLALGVVAVLWAGTAIYLFVRRHIKGEAKKTPEAESNRDSAQS